MGAEEKARRRDLVVERARKLGRGTKLGIVGEVCPEPAQVVRVGGDLSDSGEEGTRCAICRLPGHNRVTCSIFLLGCPECGAGSGEGCRVAGFQRTHLARRRLYRRLIGSRRPG